MAGLSLGGSWVVPNQFTLIALCQAPCFSTSTGPISALLISKGKRGESTSSSSVGGEKAVYFVPLRMQTYCSSSHQTKLWASKGQIHQVPDVPGERSQTFTPSAAVYFLVNSSLYFIMYCTTVFTALHRPPPKARCELGKNLEVGFLLFDFYTIRLVFFFFTISPYWLKERMHA